MSKTTILPDFLRRNTFGLLSVALLLYIIGRFTFVLHSLAHRAYESGYEVCGFFTIVLTVLTGPGLFFWAKLKPKTDNPFIFPVFVTATSLGTSMAVRIKESKWAVPVLFALIFPIVFIKGNGFAACIC